MYSTVCLKVHLTRVKPKIPDGNTKSVVGNIHCPGCNLLFNDEEKCIEHLLQQCLKIRKYESNEEDRTKVMKWISKYFHGCCNKVVKDSGSIDSENTTNDETNDVEVKRPRLIIRLREIAMDLQCPVCAEYFYPAKACCKHLFKNCLFTDKLDNAIPIKNWLSQYLWYNNKNTTAIPTSSEKIYCKYCRVNVDNKNNLMAHYQECHRQECITEGPTCVFCNFKALSGEKLIKHLIAKHVKCGCGSKQNRFNVLKDHFRNCTKLNEAVCPICKQVNVDSFQSEAQFGNHLLNCNRPVVLDFSTEDLYFECDICGQPVFKCDSDAHLAQHFKFGDFSGRRQKRVFVNLNELKDALPSEDFHKLQSLFK